MAASFLQYCATCEKQIVVPNNAILYCSENCRRKDAVKPPAAALSSLSESYLGSSPLLSSDASYSHHHTQVHDIVAPASPTSPAKISPFPRSISDDTHSHTHSHTFEAEGDDRPKHTRSASHPHFRELYANAPPLTSHHAHMLSMSFDPNRPLPPRTTSYSSTPRSISLVTPFLPADPTQQRPPMQTQVRSRPRRRGSSSSRSRSSSSAESEDTNTSAEDDAAGGRAKSLKSSSNVALDAVCARSVKRDPANAQDVGSVEGGSASALGRLLRGDRDHTK